MPSDPQPADPLAEARALLDVIERAPGPINVELVPTQIGMCYKFTPSPPNPINGRELAICLYVNGMHEWCKKDPGWAPFHDAATAFVAARNDAPAILRELLARVAELEGENKGRKGKR